MTDDIRALLDIPKQGPGRLAALRRLIAADLEDIESRLITDRTTTVYDLDALAYFVERGAAETGADEAALLARIPKAAAAMEVVSGDGAGLHHCRPCGKLSVEPGESFCAACAEGVNAIREAQEQLVAARKARDSLLVWTLEEQLEHLHADHRDASVWLGEQE